MTKRTKETTLHDLLETWLNGNRTDAREAVRRNADDRAMLALMIARYDSPAQAQKFLDGF